MGETMPETVNPSLTSFDAWKPAEKDLEDLYEISSRSLEEVKALTEYEDQKAQRILAAIAFLAALAGAALSTLQKVTPWSENLDGIAILIYGLFAIYAVMVTVGASIVLYAVKPRFNIPKNWKSGSNGSPKSRLFFEKITELDKSAWELSFANTEVSELKIAYIKDFIRESHLVAEKIRHKMGPLTLGISLLEKSTWLLGVWLIAAALSAFSVAGMHPSTPKVDAKSPSSLNSQPTSSTIQIFNNCETCPTKPHHSAPKPIPKCEISKSQCSPAP